MRALTLVIAGLAGLVPGLASCAATDRGEGEGQPGPAVLVSPDAADIAEVARAAEALTGASGVTLTGDVLTESPEMVLERRAMRSLEGGAVDGLMLERPPRLRLVTDGRDCVLLLDGTDKRETLSGVTCTAYSG